MKLVAVRVIAHGVRSSFSGVGAVLALWAVASALQVGGRSAGRIVRTRGSFTAPTTLALKGSEA
jgi:hypothetical protein